MLRLREQIKRQSIDSWNASRIQSHANKSGKNKGFESGAQKSAPKNKK